MKRLAAQDGQFVRYKFLCPFLRSNRANQLDPSLRNLKFCRKFAEQKNYALK